MPVKLTVIKNRVLPFQGFNIEEITNLNQLKDYYKVMSAIFHEVIEHFKDEFFKIDAIYGFGKHLPKRNYVEYLDWKPVASSRFILAS